MVLQAAYPVFVLLAVRRESVRSHLLAVGDDPNVIPPAARRRVGATRRVALAPAARLAYLLFAAARDVLCCGPIAWAARAARSLPEAWVGLILAAAIALWAAAFLLTASRPGRPGRVTADGPSALRRVRSRGDFLALAVGVGPAVPRRAEEGAASAAARQSDWEPEWAKHR